MIRRSTIKAEPVTALQPSGEALSVGYLLGRARASLLSGLDAELAPFDLTGMQFAALKHIGEGAARTAADLCRFMQYDTGAMTRILDRLEAKGLVRRERSREDRRIVMLRLTPDGREQSARLTALAVRVLEAHLAGFSNDETEVLKSYLGRMIDNGQALGDTRETGTGGKS
jgi:DNA-binding MarR family transcriptional regulator